MMQTYPPDRIFRGLKGSDQATDNIIPSETLDENILTTRNTGVTDVKIYSRALSKTGLKKLQNQTVTGGFVVSGIGVLTAFDYR
jgi:hypothetical protein